MGLAPPAADYAKNWDELLDKVCKDSKFDSAEARARWESQPALLEAAKEAYHWGEIEARVDATKQYRRNDPRRYDPTQAEIDHNMMQWAMALRAAIALCQEPEAAQQGETHVD